MLAHVTRNIFRMNLLRISGAIPSCQMLTAFTNKSIISSNFSSTADERIVDNVNPEDIKTPELMEKINSLTSNCEKLKENVNELDDKYKRALAESENMRKRLMKQIEDAKIFGVQSFCKDLLDVADVLTKATESVTQEQLDDKNNSTFINLYQGLKMTEQQMLQEATSGSSLDQTQAILNQCTRNLDDIDRTLISLIANDNLLSDILIDPIQTRLPSSKSIRQTIDLHHGKLMKLKLIRCDGIRLPLIIPIEANVAYLRSVVQEAVETFLDHLRGTVDQPQIVNSNSSTSAYLVNEARASALLTSNRFISWSAFWRQHSLAVMSSDLPGPPSAEPHILTRLTGLNKRLMTDYGLRNGDLITFVNRLKDTF